jgi:competence protein ComEC
MLCLLAFCAGVGAVALLPGLPPWGSMLPLSGLALLLPGRARWVGLAFCVGLLRTSLHGADWVERRLPATCERLPVTLSGRVASLPETGVLPTGLARTRFLLDVDALSPAHCTGPARLSLSLYGADKPTLVPGDALRLRARLRIPWGQANPGSGSAQAWFAAAGIDALGTVSAILEHERRHDWRYRHQEARGVLRYAIAQVDSGPRERALLTALAIGDRSGIRETDAALFRQLGLAHLLVISGLHVSLAAAAGAAVAAAGLRILRLCGLSVRRRAWPPLVGLAVAALYTALAGFSLPAVRALVMVSGVVAALACARQAASPRTLLLALALLLCLNPLAPVASSFWLSGGAVAALLWWVAWHRGQGSAALPGLHFYLSVALLPVTILWFGAGSLVGALANLLAVPLVSVFVVPLTLLGAVLWPLLDSVALEVWALAGGLLEGLLWFADTLSRDLAEALYLQRPAHPVGLVLAIAAAVLLALPLGLRDRLAAGCLLLPLLLGLPRPGAPWRAELTVLDVGQGMAVLVTDGERSLLYDTGVGDPGGFSMAERVVAPFLRERGLPAPETLVVSHADRDHSGGVAFLLDALPPARILLGEALPGGPAGEPCRTGRAWRWPSGVRFQVLAGGGADTPSGNAASCVLLVDLLGLRVALPGDITEARERELVAYWRDGLRAHWLIAAHHGSGSSTGAAWLRAVEPEGIVFSTGRANPFGHPHPDVLQRAQRRGLTILSTAEEGAISFRVYADGTRVIRRERRGYQPFWRLPATAERGLSRP